MHCSDCCATRTGQQRQHHWMNGTAQHGSSTHSMTSQGSSLRASRSAIAGAGPRAPPPWEEPPAAPAAPSASAGWYTSLRAHTAASAGLPPRACAMSSRTLQQATPPHWQWWSAESGAQPGSPPGPAAACSRSQPLALARKRSSACPAKCGGRHPSSKQWKEAGQVWREWGGLWRRRRQRLQHNVSEQAAWRTFSVVGISRAPAQCKPEGRSSPEERGCAQPAPHSRPSGPYGLSHAVEQAWLIHNCSAGDERSPAWSWWCVPPRSAREWYARLLLPEPQFHYRAL